MMRTGWLWLALVLSLAGAMPAQAGNWEADYEPGAWFITMLVVNREGYREAEKLAVGCSAQTLFVERYAPAGARPRSTLSLDGAAGRTVSWDRLDAPNTMWSHGVAARSLVTALLSARQATFQELDEPARPPVSFDLAGARDAIAPVLKRCGETALLAAVDAEPVPPGPESPDSGFRRGDMRADESRYWGRSKPQPPAILGRM